MTETGRAVPAIAIAGVSKTYASGFQALQTVDLTIQPGEIFALLGPNGAGKTTLISIICGLVSASTGSVAVLGHDVVRDWRQARTAIGLVPQELTTERFETVIATVRFTRGLFGKPPDPAYLESVLRDLSLWDKRDDMVITLSGGMKRRVLIAKALSHEPRVLFLDEPTAGVDVELRRDMWRMVRRLRDSGVTIFLTTHYIEEAEDMADRIGIINGGRLMLVEDKTVLMDRLGTSELIVTLPLPLPAVPDTLAGMGVELRQEGTQLAYRFDRHSETNGVGAMLRALDQAGIELRGLQTRQSSLQEIFVNLLQAPA